MLGLQIVIFIGCIIVSPGKADLFKMTGITGVRVRYVETEVRYNIVIVISIDFI